MFVRRVPLLRASTAVVLFLLPWALEAATAPAPPKASLARAPDPVIHGQWSGQVQYIGAVTGVPTPTEHSIMGIMLLIKPNYAVSGFSSKSGCHFLGVASPLPMAGGDGNVKLDLMASGCRYATFNRRFLGTAKLHPGDGVVDLLLRGGEGKQRFEISGVVRRADRVALKPGVTSALPVGAVPVSPAKVTVPPLDWVSPMESKPEVRP